MILGGMEPGHLAYVEYAGFGGVIHTRLLLHRVEADEWMILTPDRDMYSEVLSADNPDFSRFFHSHDGSLPPRIPRNQIYSFGDMSARDYASFLARGRREAEAEQLRRGIGPARAAAPPADPVAPVAVGSPVGVAGIAEDDPEKWILAEMLDGHKIGEEVTAPAVSLIVGNRGLIHLQDDQKKDHVVMAAKVRLSDMDAFCEERIRLARESVSCHGDDTCAADDVRTLSILYGANGERNRNFRDSVKEMKQVEFDDFPLSLRTCQAYVKAVSDASECCYAQHLAWVQQTRIPDGDRAVYEDEVLSKVVDTAIRYDGLNIVNLASFELIVRRKQLLAEAHVLNPSAPTYEAADFFMDNKYRPGGGIVVPALTQQVAQRMHEESQVMKEKRKLIEAKGSGKKGKNNTPPKKDLGGAAKSELRRWGVTAGVISHLHRL